MMFRNIGFRHQLGIIFSIGMLMLALASTLVVSRLSGQTVRERLIDEGLKLTETFAEQSTLALLYQSDDSAAEVARVFLSFPDIQGVQILDVNQRPLYDANMPRMDELIAPSSVSAGVLSRETSEFWEFSAPVSTGGDGGSESPFSEAVNTPELIGFVRVVMGKETLKNMEFDIFIYNLVVSLGLASILLLALLAVTNRVTRPLQDLAKIMRQAEGGEKKLRAELKGTSDIRIMENAFNTMMNVLDGREEALKSARDQALESAKSKAEFAANVSHELRTPMNGVLGMLDLLADGGMSEKQAEFVGVAKNSAESLLSLIDDLLSFSKNESGKASIDLREFNLADSFSDIIALLAPQARAKSLDFAFVIEEQVTRNLVGDHARLKQVLVNLAGNAIKFTEKGYVGFHVSVIDDAEDRVTLRFEVSDSGVGISREEQGRIFEAFSQADESTTRRFGGTGLGLAISRQLVQLMNGEMGVESRYGQGSLFWFTLPFLKSKDPVASLKPSLKYSHLRILVVDNSELIHRSLGRFFADQDCFWDSASSYGDAVHKLKLAREDIPYDFVMVDEHLDRDRGQEFAYFVKDSTDYNSTHCVMMTHRVIDSVNSGERTPWSSVSKPIQKSELIVCLNRFLGQVELVPATQMLALPGEASTAKPDVCRILVVEDDRANQFVALGMLETIGCDADLVSNGRECLERLGDGGYDLILMDCHMPELDGYKTTSLIREKEGKETRLPIIAMTANILNGESDKCIAAGMDDYLSKPLTRDALKQKLQHWLRPGQLPAQLNQNVVSASVATVSETQSESSAQHVDVIDEQVLNTLQEQLGGAVEKIISALLEDLPSYLAALVVASEKLDANRLADTAHTIKGSASNVGANRLVSATTQLEYSARSGDLTNIEDQVAQIQREGNAVLECLRSGETTSPVSLVRAQNQHITESDSVYAGQPRILIVDDDRGSRLAMMEVLRSEGYWVDEASDGQVALTFCETQAPDLILMDAVMPTMDGFTACALLQKMSQTKNVPVLIITALNDEASISRAFSSGATDYISKPVNFWVLSKRINHLVQARHAERHVHQLAYNDTLTGLPNRTLFTERMSDAIVRPRQSTDQLAVLFLDLDRFKLVNDTLGHETGDLLLKYFAERVQGCLRKDDMVARFGGDEFTILLDGVKSRDVICSIAEKIHDQLSKPFVFMGKEMYVSTSIGIAMFPEHGKDIGTLLKSADMAMYRAKKIGEKYQYYEQQMEAEVTRRLELENDLRGALERNEFLIYYQPQEDLASGEIIALEALLRWEHPQRGVVGPDEFIQLAEETAQIIDLGEWVLRTVCEQMASWRERGFMPIRVSVNLSGKQISQPNLVSTLSSIIEDASLSPELLELEITESTIMEDPEQVIATLGQLKSMGLSLAIDDFGTGYSSLNYLRRFPIDVIKIDRSFVSDITSNKVDADIVKTIIDLAHVLGVSVVAEGVETQSQKTFLKEQRCDLAQGYHLSRPVQVEEAEVRFLKHLDTVGSKAVG